MLLYIHSLCTCKQCRCSDECLLVVEEGDLAPPTRSRHDE